MLVRRSITVFNWSLAETIKVVPTQIFCPVCIIISPPGTLRPDEGDGSGQIVKVEDEWRI